MRLLFMGSFGKDETAKGAKIFAEKRKVETK